MFVHISSKLTSAAYPENGPQPSKLGVLFYIMSILFSAIGIISLTNYPFVTEVSSANSNISCSCLCSNL